MKFTVSSFALRDKLNNAATFIPSNPSMPILENFKFALEGDLLTVTASDLQKTIVTLIDVSGEIDGAICVPAKMLLETLRNLPDIPVTFAMNESEQIAIVSQTGKYTLTGEGVDGYPILQDIDGQTFQIQAYTFQECLKRTYRFASSDEMKPNMNGVYFNVDSNGKLTFVSTDGHRLAKYTAQSEYDFSGMENPISCIISNRAIPDIIKALTEMSKTEANGFVNVSMSDSHVRIQSANTTIIARLIDEKFPDYENVIPVKSDKTVTVDLQKVLGSLKRVSIYANRSTNQVRLKPENEMLELSAEDLDFANGAKELMFAESTGGPIEIGFNSRFMLECLSVFKSEKVILNMTEPNRAAVIRGLDEIDEGLLVLVMPVMLNNYY